MLARLLGQMVAVVTLINTLVAVPMAAAQTGVPGRVVKIVAFGDSLTAGYGLERQQAFPVVLERLLRARGHGVEVINAGVSGDTTATALQRLEWVLPDDAEGVIVELGANDMLRGQSPEQARANLDAIVRKLKARGLEVLIAGMRATRNLGDAYANAFDRIYPELAEAHGLIAYPFFLAGVALDPKLNLNDGLHPNAAGIEVIAQRIVPTVEELLARIEAKRKAGAAN